MEERYKMNRKAFTLFETLIAALILVIVGTGITAMYVVESSLLTQTLHRIEAMNYAQSCANMLMSIAEVNPYGTDFWYGYYEGPPELSSGLHSEATDPKICGIPDSDFKKTFKVAMKYEIDKVVLIPPGGYADDPSYSQGTLRAKITVEWEEKFPKDQKKTEILYIAPCYYYEFGG